MRRGLQDSGFIGTDASSIIGFSLGWDHVAEHEWGIRTLRDKFNAENPRKKGFERNKIREDSALFFERPDLKIIGITSKDSDFVSSENHHIDHYLQEDPTIDPDLNLGYWPYWDGNDFLLLVQDTPVSRGIFSQLKKLFNAKDMVIFLTGRDNPFAGSGLTFAAFSKIPDQAKKARIDAEKERDDLDSRMKKMPGYLALRAKSGEWDKSHKGISFHDNPWGAIFLGNPREDSNGELILWLNPSNQSHLNAAWVNNQDLLDWANGKPGVVIKSQELWNELLWMCKVSCSYSIGASLHLFNRFPEERLVSPGGRYSDSEGKRVVGKGFPKPMQLPSKDFLGIRRLHPDMIAAVEKHVKHLLIRDFTDQVEYGDKDILDVTHPSKEIENEIYGFFEALRFLGLETQSGFSNTPCVRENFGWWKDLLILEARWEFLISKKMAYQPWVDNGVSEFVKQNFLSYRRHGFDDQEEEYSGLDIKFSGELADMKKTEEQNG